MKVKLIKTFCALSLLGVFLQAEAATEAAQASDPKLEAHVLEIAANLRCLVCQNQSIAESHAPLALDLRAQVRQQLEAGKSEEQIRKYMVARYGDFVLYDPPFQWNTFLLWLGPFAAMVLGLFFFIRMIRHRPVASAPVLSAEQKAQAEQLLADAQVVGETSPTDRATTQRTRAQ